ncbi:hypothetical protein E1A91_A03G149400v1 [Gossypium mustelinum]|uniref:Uncharacterized protein n=2 Tax=Gossypium TaxID=3633 RepID=A0A0D2PSG4_GOSRA|nr:hypothetical protein B456_001G166200 [Gossypium raimondii]TYJ43387.1 hypothetical protein E1A91_A03G149400v1 [Gossypium mustelinum]
MNLSRWRKGIAINSYRASKNKKMKSDDEFLRGPRKSKKSPFFIGFEPTTYAYFLGRLKSATLPLSCTPNFPGIVVQSVRAPPCQGGSCGFEPRQSRPRIR